jgi:hypothetical protein
MNWVVILALGFVLLLLLWATGRNHGVPVEGAGAPSPDPAEHPIRLPPHALLGRCLSVEDAEFAASLGSPAVLRLLLRDRRQFALEWLRQTRSEAGRLLRLHVRAVRYAAGLRPGREVALLFFAGMFFAVYEMLALCVRLYGPFRTRQFVHALHGLARVLTALGARIAASAVPSAAIPETVRG